MVAKKESLYQRLLPLRRGGPATLYQPSRPGPSVALFVTFEGIDGSGKSTLARTLEERLRKGGVDAVLTKEPTRTWLGQAVRRAVEAERNPFVQALLFLADRSLHTEEIQAWLDAGRVVLCDRYHDSTLAYQGVALRGRVEDPVDWLQRAAPFVREPDLTFLLVVDPEEGLRRVAAVREPTPFERTAYLQEVQGAYRALAAASRFVVLDANRPSRVVEEEAGRILEKRLHK